MSSLAEDDPGPAAPGPDAPPPAPVRKPRWWRKPLTVSMLIAIGLHLPFTPALPLWRALQRLAIMREPPREEDHPEVPDMTVELLAPPTPTAEPTAGPDAVALPPPTAAAPTAAARPASKVADADKKASDKAEAAKKAAAEKAEAAKKAEAEKVAEAEKKRAEAASKKADGKEKPGREADDPESGRFAGGSEDGASGDEKTAADGTEQGRGGRVGLKGKVNENKTKPPVSLALWFGEMREHVLGGAVGGLLACNPDWKPFLQRGVRPLEDFTGLLMVGPQFQRSQRMSVAVEHRLEATRLHDELDALVQRSGAHGKWIEDGVAQVVVQRQPRVIIGRSPSMLFLAPADRWKELSTSGATVSLPEARGRVAALALQKPGSMLKRLGVDVPASISELRLELFANKDGSVDTQLDFEDASVADAMKHAAPLGRSLEQLATDVTQLARTASSLAPASVAGDLRDEDFKLPVPELSAVGSRLTTTLRLTTAQTGKLLGMLARATCPKKPAGR